MNVPQGLALCKEIRGKIIDAGFSFTGNGAYAKSYMNALEQCVRENPSEPEHAIKVQVMYIFTNLRARTPEQKSLKKEMLKWGGSK